MWDDISGSVGFSKVDGLVKFSLARTGPTGRQVTVNQYITRADFKDALLYKLTLDRLVERMAQAVV